MKKFTFAVMALLACSFSLKAQQFVSTEPANRNVVLEEFTGRTCGYCPEGHVIANQIKANNPDRFWSVNIHSNGYFSLTTYPNLNTVKGNQIRAAFNAESFPSGVVNRSTAAAVGRGSWTSYANQQMGQAAECNVGGMVVLNPVTREAKINVEVYYTGNSASDENYLTIMMLQDSIWGSQSYGQDNPEQWQNGQYCHMHILRDIITETMGDPISPTTQGTLLTKTYTYTVPEVIGTPNGVDVDLNNIHFLAYVSEKYQGTPTRPVLNANELMLMEGSDEPILPAIKDAKIGLSCSFEKDLYVDVMNIGTEVLTSLSLQADVEGQLFSAEWSGSLEPLSQETVVIPIELPFGEHQTEISLTQANGTSLMQKKTYTFEGLEWINHEVQGVDERLKLILVQDKYGEQITWECVASNGEVLASGGPYSQLLGANATQPNVEYITVPANECVRFSIYDKGNNGICCTYGNGYFTISDSNNNVIIGDHDNGDFGSMASFMISTHSSTGTNVAVGATQVNVVSTTEADFVCPLQTNIYPEQVGFVYRKVTSSEQMTVIGVYNEFQKILASVSDLDPDVVYSVKAFATVSGETYFGPEYHFSTSNGVGISEMESSLKVYPNPTSGVLNVEAGNMSTVEVYNAVGQCVMKQNVNGDKTQINTESLNNGMYVVRIHANDGAIINRTFSVAR